MSKRKPTMAELFNFMGDARVQALASFYQSEEGELVIVAKEDQTRAIAVVLPNWTPKVLIPLRPSYNLKFIRNSSETRMGIPSRKPRISVDNVFLPTDTPEEYRDLLHERYSEHLEKILERRKSKIEERLEKNAELEEYREEAWGQPPRLVRRNYEGKGD